MPKHELRALVGLNQLRRPCGENRTWVQNMTAQFLVKRGCASSSGFFVMGFSPGLRCVFAAVDFCCAGAREQVKTLQIYFVDVEGGQAHS